ncbi:2'-5' RNA ligase family protein [Zunongwangia sp. H14]|uniref:2'-5' RNA ligase family protein n=1 Tax=Zunongwangia sp. H14 TaxID=3240792 RepID=UPI003563DDAA
MKKSLYFIAIVPDAQLEEKIRRLKLEIRKKYDSAKALKLPAHITLQIPFKINEEDETSLLETLQIIVKNQKSFDVQISGFGRFSSRTIFINVVNPATVISLHSKVQSALDEKFKLNERERTKKIHPHITIAKRDLSRLNFQKAWPQFENRSFEEAFTAGGLIVFRHNGKIWEMLQEFSFPQ